MSARGAGLKAVPKTDRYTPVLPGALHLGVVRAHRFELVDKDGRTRGGIGFTDDGTPAIILADDDGRHLVIRASLELHADGPRLHLNRGKGSQALALGVTEDMAGLRFDTRAGKARMVFGLDSHDVAIASVFGRNGSTRRFLKKPFHGPTLADLRGIFRPLARAGKKAEFIRQLAERWDITEGAEDLWRKVRKAVRAEAGASRKPKAVAS